MPLFKKITHKLDDQKFVFNINVNDKGKFWFSPNDSVKKAVEGDDEYVFDTFDEAKQKAWDLFDGFVNSKTSMEYFIRYKLFGSTALKRMIPDNIMTPEVWEKTIPSVNTRFAELDKGVVIEWYPLVKERVGKGVTEYILQRADEDDVETLEQHGEDYFNLTRSPHVLFDGEITFVQEGEDHVFYEDQENRIFDIPLTEETLEFFENTEKSLAGIFTKMIVFLFQEPDKLMASISKALKEGKKNNLLGE